jgi:hypothetical protein
MQVEMIEFGQLPNFTMLEKLDMLKELLQESTCNVKFTKVDGTERELICTLNPDILKETVFSDSHKRKTPEETGVLPVYLPQSNEWRSFKIDNVISIEVCDEA